MAYAKARIIDLLCNIYKALFAQQALDPLSDLSYDDYRNAMFFKTLPELMKEISTDLVYYALNIFRKSIEISRR